MKSPHFLTALFACLVVLAISVPASASFTIYDKEGTTFGVDGSFNTFYVYSDSDKNTALEQAFVLDALGNPVLISRPDRKQSRVKMGFLPNWIGFNFSKQVGDLKIGGRSSFWVNINDSQTAVTDTGIDVRQFYGTVGSDWGQVLLGKDFGLFSRSNIFLDEILQGYGNVSDTLGLIDGGGVSFGNIGTGYIYPMPSAQITYRTPDLAGFKLAIGLVDPAHTTTTATDVEEDTPRIEGELTYNYALENGNITAWVGFLHQKSESNAGDNTSKGLSYGVKAKLAGAALMASGFDAEGVGLLLGPAVDNIFAFTQDLSGDEAESDGYLLQASYILGNARFVGSYGQNEIDDVGFFGLFPGSWENKTTTGAVFYAFNDNLSVVAEYNVNEITINDTPFGDLEEKTKTIALGGIINF